MSASATPGTEPASNTQRSLGVNFYLLHPDNRFAMLARCDRTQGHLTTLHLPGERPLDCESAISALSKVYVGNRAALYNMLHRCAARIDERELFSECRAAKLAQTDSP